MFGALNKLSNHHTSNSHYVIIVQYSMLCKTVFHNSNSPKPLEDITLEKVVLKPLLLMVLYFYR